MKTLLTLCLFRGEAHTPINAGIPLLLPLKFLTVYPIYSVIKKKKKNVLSVTKLHEFA